MFLYEEFVSPWGAKYHQRLEKWVSEPGGYVVHLKMGEEIVGICEASLRKNEEGMSSTIFVDSRHRRKGYAKFLEESALQFLRENGKKLPA